MTRHVVGPASDLPAGARKLVTVQGRAIALFNIEGELFAIADRCPHSGGSLVHGYLTGLLTSSCPGEYDYAASRESIRCPWHAWEFNLRTGRSQCEPDRMKVRTFPASIATGETLVAETFTVAVEDSYIVLDT